MEQCFAVSSRSYTFWNSIPKVFLWKDTFVIMRLGHDKSQCWKQMTCMGGITLSLQYLSEMSPPISQIAQLRKCQGIGTKVEHHISDIYKPVALFIWVVILHPSFCFLGTMAEAVGCSCWCYGRWSPTPCALQLSSSNSKTSSRLWEKKKYIEYFYVLLSRGKEVLH